jgi:hypothetical protein
MADPIRAKFAETVAVNRAVNVRLFQEVAAAAQWLAAEELARPRISTGSAATGP